jgi:hypothetical protein
MLKRLLLVGLFCASNFTCFGSGNQLPGAESPEAALAVIFNTPPSYLQSLFCRLDLGCVPAAEAHSVLFAKMERLSMLLNDDKARAQGDFLLK